MKAVWNETEIASSENTVVVEGNHYFPMASVNRELLRDSATHTNCPWKGQASYFDIVVGDNINSDAAWYYAKPKKAAAEIADHVAFWRGVQITE